VIKKILCVILITMTLFIVPACITEGTDPKDRAYDQDGLLGMTNTNPNLPTSPTHYNYKNDLNLMEAALDEIPGVISHRIIINGGNVYVNLHVQEGLSYDEVAIIEGEAYNSLSLQVPRYQFILEVDI